MISAKLVKLIEENAETLTQEFLKDVQTNSKTLSYHDVSTDELHTRTYNVYKNLSDWLIDKTEKDVEEKYMALGRKRKKEGTPLSQLIYVISLTKSHLISYVKRNGLADTVLEFYQELELFHMVTQFYDRAIYYTICGYEGE
jgi:glutamate synthase domain-containing protein 1